MGLARVAGARVLGWAAVLTVAALASPARGQARGRGARAVGAEHGEPAPIVLAADRDDDDVNGLADAEQAELPPAARADLVPIDRGLVGARLHPIAGGDRLRVIAGGRPLAWSTPLPPGAMLQGVLPGRAAIVAEMGGGAGARQAPMVVDVVGVSMRDGAGRDVDFTRDHASLERTPPARALGGADALYDDPDALRVVLEESEELAQRERNTDLADAMIVSLTADGDTLDQLRVGLSTVPCRAGASSSPGSPPMRCAASAPVRFVIDEVDQKHPLVRDRSVRAQVGGAIVVRRGGHKLQAIRVLGPRATSAGPIGRLRATLRPFVLRVIPGGGPAIGGTDLGAAALLRGELALASAIWGQCGVTFGTSSADRLERGGMAPPVDVHVVDPPPSHLLALGDDLGLPATGGDLHFRVDAKELAVTLAPQTTPEAAAEIVARAAERAGFVAVITANARIAPAAAGSVDVSLRRRDGRLATIERASSGAPLSTDPTLVVRIGSVDLSDGLQHFGDMDSMSGTVEERTLVKAFDDGDPSTVELVIVPLFTGGGRIGESFIASDLSSVRNVVILDRAGIRARRSSLTLAHELGHVLMDLPGHPDDYGVDTPTLLMDSDGSDASPFGPRRLTLDECARVVRQSGPRARLPLLRDQPLAPIRW